MKRKLVYIVSFLDKSLPFEWVIQRLDRNQYELAFIVIGNTESPLALFIKAQNIQLHGIPFSGKKDIFKTIVSLFRILAKLKPDIVHAHLFDAGRMAIPVAWLLRIKKRIYTRHYSTYHHDYFPQGVIYDRIINTLATDLIAISQVVAHVLVTRENVPKRKVKYVPHGFDFSYFKARQDEAKEARIRYAIPVGKPVIGVISRFTELKGIEYIIVAFSKFRNRFPEAHLVLANAEGDYRLQVFAILQRELPPGSYTTIRFEENVRALYALFDIFVHVPIDGECEAFGQAYVEALAMKVPSIFTLSGIANEFIRHEANALVVEHKNSMQIEEAMVKLWQSPERYQPMCNEGEREVVKRFGIDLMVERLDKVYCDPA